MLSFSRLTTLSTIFLIIAAGAAKAQESGFVSGTARDAQTGEPLPGVNMQLTESSTGSATDADGSFTIGPLDAGTYTLQASYIGYRKQSQSLQIAAGDTLQVQLALAPRTVGMEALEVTAYYASRQASASELRESDIQEANPRASGELLRKISGMDAVRRGAVGLDPVVRGLRETEVGVYVDGMRTFPAGPARMDSPLSHSGPSTIRSIQVVKGPYALTQGPGNMSAIQVKTVGLWDTRAGLLHGQLQGGYDTNFNSYETTFSTGGRQNNWAYRVNGAWRQGNDYQSGGGRDVPGDFQNRELRGQLGYRLSSNSRLSVSGGYQQQDDVAYPGRLLSAKFFKSGRGRLRYEYNSPAGLLRSVEAQAYGYQTLHTMNNEGKPTFNEGMFPNGDRRPPLRIAVNADITTVGGSVSGRLAPTNTMQLTLGGDFYQAFRNAERPFFAVTPNGPMVPPFYESDQIWPGVTTANGGLFAKATQLLGSVEATGTVRVDFVSAGTDENSVSDVFLENANVTSGQLDQNETNLSGALMFNLPLSDQWALSLGGGTTVRTADALERYSDRFPANKAQTSAEFVGNPLLDPERSLQTDAELEGRYARFNVKLSGFARRMNNYITLTPTDIDPMLPLPIFANQPVYQYINGEANFYGAEVAASYRLIKPLTASIKASYLWGKNKTTGQPALGVSPLSADLGFRYEPLGGRYFVEASLRAVSEQDRTAGILGESATDGYVTLDLKGGVDVGRGISLKAGVSNLTDADYVNHLNARNPYSGIAIPEPGRVIFGDITIRF
jgi:iron complex outermembrane receptor protein